MKGDGKDQPPIEDIVAEFLLEREEGRNPSIDEWLARYPKHAEILAQLLSDDAASPATMRRPVTSGTGGRARITTRAARDDATRIGPYEVLDHVSTAGGGTVYRARHREGGHLVALKVLDSRGAIDPRDVERFHREAAMLRAMNLVHVVPVLDAGEDGGRSWIAMKWLEGDTFSKLREAAAEKTHRLHDPRERARLVARVARTFEAIHSYGILHRDVKPTNIMVDRTGEPMIIDFGIAQAPDLPELTTTIDQVMGTPRFLAPELLAGGNRQVSPKTDVYGLGLCLYELCTGSEAFKAEARADLFASIRTTGPAHPLKANPALSHDFAAVILRAIEIDPARRYPDMKSFADDLDRIARAEAPDPATLRGANPLLRAVRRHRTRIVAAAVLAAVVIPALWMWISHAKNAAAARSSEATLRPFAWFAPDAFAGEKRLLPLAAAAELAHNPVANADQRLMAAWIAFAAGNIEDARAELGPVGKAAGDSFAARLFQTHLEGLKAVARQGHTAGTFFDPNTKKPKINPVTGEAFEALVPEDAPAGTYVRDPADFEASLKAECERGEATSPVDHLVLATLRWSVLPLNPAVDTKARRADIRKSLDRAIEDRATRTPATHLQGVMKFLDGDLKGARDDLSSVFEAQGAALGTRYLLGVVLARAGDPKSGVGHLDAVVRELPLAHEARPKLLGQLALARAAGGQIDGALDACKQWRTERERGGQLWDLVMPRVIAARVLREHRDLAGAKNLLLEAIREDERFHREDRDQNEKGLPEDKRSSAPLMLWEHPFRELISVGLELGDDDLVNDSRDRMATFTMKPVPKSAEAWLDMNLAGLRCADFGRPKYEPPPPPKNE